MRVLLVEPDYYARYPPLGLLKIATFHRLQGDEVYLVRGLSKVPKPELIYVTSLFTYAWRPVRDAISYYRAQFPDARILLGGIYASLLPEHASTLGANEVHVGLMQEVEDLVPSWDLIPAWDGSIVFASRGCIRKCGFCSVPKLEGPPSDLRKGIRRLVYPRHTRIVLWDNNMLGNANWEPIFDELSHMDLMVDFNQGLDARRVTDKVAQKLSRLKLQSIRMAYDYPGVGPAVEKAVHVLAENGISPRRVVVYTLYNYVDDPENFKERVTQLLSWGVTSYPMRFEPLTSLTKNEWVSPHWTRDELQMVAASRRVLGYAGAFPPYEVLLEKLSRARGFDEAFRLGKPGEFKHKASRRRLPRYAGPLDWYSYVSRVHES
ncbi:MAG: hypothetical protein JRN35_06875 [Nitrososphaerota archaeon]|nr:hypothetical protein [Nitrososphaerota archaeon]